MLKTRSVRSIWFDTLCRLLSKRVSNQNEWVSTTAVYQNLPLFPLPYCRSVFKQKVATAAASSISVKLGVNDVQQEEQRTRNEGTAKNVSKLTSLPTVHVLTRNL